jgi:arginine decarboxylase
MEAFRQMVETAISNDRLRVRDRKALIEAYRDSINGYTYYE